MKLSKISDKKLTEAEVLNEKKQAEAAEHTGPIPGMTMDDPDYEMMRKRLSKIKQTNPALYKRMINWD